MKSKVSKRYKPRRADELGKRLDLASFARNSVYTTDGNLAQEHFCCSHTEISKTL